jgi:formate--tetrahydrofolate ligase
MEPIAAIARKLGIEPKYLVPYGDDKAKVSLDAIKPGVPRGKLIAVTGITPTPAGEGKTTTAIGLTDALAKRGHKAAVTLREPSLGLNFGIKGGGTGGGWATVVPEDSINLHFTGDSHAVASAHNLLAALTENAVRRQSIAGLTAEGIVWRRVNAIEDRALRNVVTGVGGDANGPVRNTAFDITEASEVMAILALAKHYDDLRRRLGAITIGYTVDGRAVRAGEVGAVGSMMALLKDALLPNLVQTGAGQPAFVHTGPFANIAHGASSVIADRMALSYADYVVTECGFGADLGFEKFMHIKMRSSGLRPAAVVLVATVRAIKSHGGVPNAALTRPDAFAVRIGAANLEHMVNVVCRFGVPVVVAINRYPSDTTEEIVILQDIAITAGAAAAVVCSAFADGTTGAEELAGAVERVAATKSMVKYLYAEDASLRDKVYAIARNVYGASMVEWSRKAGRQLDALEQQGLGGLPICMAKTPYSLSHDPLIKNRPTQFVFEINEVRVSTGAGFVYPLAGDVVTMPGMPRTPRALDLDKDGNVTGLSS